MNAERLLALYDRVADAPDAIPRLRRFVLDLAVRGKLVEQDPNDEPAEQLLKRIAAEKARLVRAGEFQEPRNAFEIKRHELPFVPPAHWRWARLIEIARTSYGFAFDSSQFNGEKRGVPLIRIRDISGTDTEAYYAGDYDPAYLVRAGDYLVGMDGDFNVRRWAGPEALLNQRVMRINSWRCEISPEFVKLPLQMILNYLHGYTSLTTVKHLSAKQVNGIEIPLPPLAEQHRIVAKVDELMALLDKLEAARSTREATRDRLTASSLARLTAPDTSPEVFPAHARFAMGALPALSARPDQIKSLRQTILNLAVRGKLVEQDPEDEPASVALNRLDVKGAVEGPFRLPLTWEWVIVGSVSQARLGKMLDEAKNRGTRRPYLRNLNVRWFDFDTSDLLEMPFEESEVDEFSLRSGDVLICEGGEPGRAAVWDNRLEGVYFQKAIHRVRFFEPVNPHFFTLALKESADDGRLAESFTGTGIKHFTGRGLTAYRFPLPPLAEQHRIVAKVDALMALCDRLEAALATSDTTRQRLLESLLHEALTEGTHNREVA